jgi:hypothetical protein
LQYLLDEAARPAPEASQEPKKKATKRARKA